MEAASDRVPQNVRFWPLADMRQCTAHVRFRGQSGHDVLHCKCSLMTPKRTLLCRILPRVVEPDSYRKYEDYHCKPDEHAAQFCVHLSLEIPARNGGSKLRAGSYQRRMRTRRCYFLARLDRPFICKRHTVHLFARQLPWRDSLRYVADKGTKGLRR
jgi:hypothetical protein